MQCKHKNCRFRGFRKAPDRNIPLHERRATGLLEGDFRAVGTCSI